tara:strand:+ start:237 stop:674 length:438 start_codon:yes stop_codon:yes gene_type:complete
MKHITFSILFFIGFIFAQADIKEIKVVKYKNNWKAYRAGVELPKSHFFRLVDDDEKMILAQENEKNFMNKKFKFACFMCGNSTLGILSLALDNQRIFKYTIYGYLGSRFVKLFIKEKTVGVTFEEAKEMANRYNDELNGKVDIVT